MIRSPRDTLGTIALQSGVPEFGPIFLAHVRGSTIDLGVWRFGGTPEWTLTVDGRDEEKVRALEQWRSEVLPSESSWLRPGVIAEPDVSVQEVVLVYDLLRGQNCPLADCPFHEFQVSDRRPSG